MYKMIPALIPAVLAASIGSASAQSPSAQGFFSNGPKFAPYFSPNGVFGGGPEYGYGYAYPYGRLRLRLSVGRPFQLRLPGSAYLRIHTALEANMTA
jgi:hypothetical protein